jgi:hypothetical protein
VRVAAGVGVWGGYPPPHFRLSRRG